MASSKAPPQSRRGPSSCGAGYGNAGPTGGTTAPVSSPLSARRLRSAWSSRTRTPTRTRRSLLDCHGIELAPATDSAEEPESIVRYSHQSHPWVSGATRRGRLPWTKTIQPRISQIHANGCPGREVALRKQGEFPTHCLAFPYPRGPGEIISPAGFGVEPHHGGRRGQASDPEGQNWGRGLVRKPLMGNGMIVLTILRMATKRHKRSQGHGLPPVCVGLRLVLHVLLCFFVAIPLFSRIFS